MATAAQMNANRANAQKSTGPTTEAGKAASCRNRLSHGFTSSALLLEFEKSEEFNALLDDLIDQFQPANPHEQILVEKMAQNQWLSVRAIRLQTIALDATVSRGYICKDLGVLIRYHTSAERAYHKACAELVKAQKERGNSEIGFESKNSAEAVEPAPASPQQTSVSPENSVPIVPAGSVPANATILTNRSTQRHAAQSPDLH